MREAVREAAGQEPLNAPTTRGSYYKAEVPDTLDLAERARLGLNYFSRIAPMGDQIQGLQQVAGI